MVQQDELTQQALSYMRYQGAKTLDDLAALMERTAADCTRCLEAMSEEQASFKPSLSGAEGPGEEWSVKEVLGHLLNSMELADERIADLAASRGPRPFADISAPSRPERSIDELRRALTRLWEETIRLVASLPEEASVDGTWEHPTFGPLNYRELIAFQRIHALDHVQQIEKIKADPAYPKV
ncbi:MAG: DinB family protein [Chloroflexi bacterium]|nr:DinB family protein [Chloroflexota bacterium]